MSWQGKAYNRSALKKIEPRLLKRHVLLFMGAIVAPCLVLVTLSVRMIEQERQLHAKRTEEERHRRVAQLGQELLSRLERIKLALAIAPAKRVHEAVVLVGSARDGHLLLPWDTNPNIQQFRQWTEAPPFSDLMRQAEREEIIVGKLDAAVRLYREALASTSQAAARAYARLSLARALRGMGKREQGFLEYKQILNSPPDLVDEHGIPLALYAAPPLLDAGMQQRETLALITELVNRSCGLPPAALYLLRDLAARLVAGDAVNRLANQIQDQEQAESLQRDFPRLLQFTQGREPVWVAYGEPLWLFSLAPQAGSTDAMVVVVRAREILTGPAWASHWWTISSKPTGEA